MAAPMKKFCLLNKLKLPRYFSQFCYSTENYVSIPQQKETQLQFRDIKSILKSQTLQLERDKLYNFQGWIKSVRSHKGVSFLNINDGSSLQNLQLVLDNDKLSSTITVGSSVEVTGNVVKSKNAKQPVEVLVHEINVIGQCNSEDFPFKVKTRHSADYTRQYPHLRPRTNTFSALLRIRNSAMMAVHNYFQESGYCHVNTPIITTNDCEGGGDVFTLTAASQTVEDIDISKKNTTDSNDNKELHFFDVPAFLTVSGQLHLEVINGAFKKVYTFGPTFRADNSMGRHHLSEFYMIEAELAFTKNTEDIIQVMEGLFKTTTEKVLCDCEEDVELYHKHVNPGYQSKMAKLLNSNFKRLTYSEAIDILQKFNKTFETQVQWGSDLNKEHEKFLVEYCDNIPIFITDFPTTLKPFYARWNEDGKTCAAVDMLVPEVGELFGGSLREERYDIIKERLQQDQLLDNFQWYLDLRQFGTVPHGGFGMGFERLLQCILGIQNIRDTIPFPRSINNCKL